MESAESVDELLRSSASRRHTHATLMNAGSSRSHLVLTLHAVMRSEPDGSERSGRLHLVDLAGSERVGKSGVTGDRMKEAQAINKSLSALEQVMLVLQGRQAGGGAKAEVHVPYRNSKLTLLLSDALGAKGACAKTIMIMQVSPAASSASEGVRTLRFGERCQSVTLGAVRRTTTKKEKSAESDQKAEKLQAELAEQKRLASEANERGQAAEARSREMQAELKQAREMLAAAELEQAETRQRQAEREAGFLRAQREKEEAQLQQVGTPLRPGGLICGLGSAVWGSAVWGSAGWGSAGWGSAV